MINSMENYLNISFGICLEVFSLRNDSFHGELSSCIPVKKKCQNKILNCRFFIVNKILIMYQKSWDTILLIDFNYVNSIGYKKYLL